MVKHLIYPIIKCSLDQVPESKQKFSDNIEPKMKIVRDAIFELLEVNAPVVAIENDRKYLEHDGNYTVLPDGTRQVRNLYEACLEVFEKNGDDYAQIIFNAAFVPGNKINVEGATVAATDVSKESLSTAEYEFHEFFKKAIEGGIADPIIQSARNFIEKEQLADEEAKHVQNVAGQLKKLGVNELEDLKYLSLQGLNLKMDVKLTPTTEKYLKELGVTDDCFDLTADSEAAVIGQGYRVSTDSFVATRIFDVESKLTQFGLKIPKIAKINPLHSTWANTNQYTTNAEIARERLSQLNLQFSIDSSELNFESGFNSRSESSSRASTSSRLISYLHEERLFEVSMGNFRDEGTKFTQDFKEEVDNLPDTFDVSDPKSRQKFESFFNQFGHCVVTKAYGGGSLEVNVDSSAVAHDFEDIRSIRAALTASLSCSGFLDEKEMSSFSSINSKKLSLKTILTQSHLKWNGGERNLHQKKTVHDGPSMDKWRNSLTKKPAMLTTYVQLEPIFTVVAVHDSSKRASTEHALKSYLGGQFKLEAREEIERKELEKKKKKIYELRLLNSLSLQTVAIVLLWNLASLF